MLVAVIVLCVVNVGVLLLCWCAVQHAFAARNAASALDASVQTLNTTVQQLGQAMQMLPEALRELKRSTTGDLQKLEQGVESTFHEAHDTLNLLRSFIRFYKQPPTNNNPIIIPQNRHGQ